MRRSPQPEVPSIVGGHPRSRVGRHRVVRGHVCFRDELGSRRPFTRGPPDFALARPESPRARPPSPPLASLRDVHAKRRGALLWVRLPPNDFCNCTSDARTHSQATDSRRILRASRSRSDLEICARARQAGWPGDLPLSKKGRECCEPRQSLRSRPYGAASTPQNETSKTTARPRRRLRATPRSDHRLRRWPLDDCAGLCGPSRPERRALPPAACCRRTARVKTPLLT